MQWFKKTGVGLIDIWNLIWSAEEVQKPLIKRTSGNNYSPNEKYPSFSELLPYRYFDSNSGLFFNTNSCGLLYQILPLTGANETLAELLDDILRNKVTEEFNIQVIWVKHNQVGNMIDSFSTQFKNNDFPHLGQIGEKLEEYYKEAARNGFKTKNQNRAGLTHTECFVVVDCENKEKESNLKAKFSQFKVSFEASLTAAKIGFISCNATDFLRLVRFYLSNNRDCIYPHETHYAIDEPLHYQTNDFSFEAHIKKDRLDISAVDPAGCAFNSSISVLTLSKLPPAYHLWENINNSNNVFERGQSIQCNHIISVTYKIDDQAKALSRANRKTRDFNKKAQSAYAINVAGTEKMAKTWRSFREDLADHKTRAVKMLYNVVLFSRPDDAENDVESAISTFRYNNIQLTVAKNMMLPYFLSSMPFTFTNRLDKDFSLPRMMWPISSWNAVQYMPLLSDWQGLSKGILMPTLRDQFNLINPFDDSLGTNFNIAITGTSGGGKSFAVQMMMLNVLFNGGDIFVVDIGGSYKKLCHALGGTYLEYENLALNPFTHIENIYEDIDDIVDLFELLACARAQASDDDRGTIREAILRAFENHKTETVIDDVCVNLIQLFSTEKETYPTAKILAKNLKRYCSGAEHGKVFNAPSKLSPNARVIIIDLKSIEDNGAIRAPVLLSVISQVQRRMFNSDRSRQKMCIIDEAWKFFTGDNIATQFITKGFRTGRRHKASFVTITQGIDDYYKFQEARAAWDNSSLKLIFLQDLAALTEHNKNHETFSEYEMKLLKAFPKAKDAGFSQVLVKSGQISSFHRLFVDPFTRVLLSSDGDDYSKVEKHVKQGMSYAKAVNTVVEEGEV